MEKQKKWKLFPNRGDRPDATAEDTTPNLRYFFKLFGRKFGKLLSLNLIMLFQYLPLLVAFLLYFFFGKMTATVESPLFAPLLGASLMQSPTASLLLGSFGGVFQIPHVTAGRMTAILILVFVTMLTWGWQNVGSTYNLRSLVRGDSCFLVSDYFYAIRRNFKQGFFLGLLDFLVIFVLLFDLIYFRAQMNTLFSAVVYLLALFLLLLYNFMRFYLYHMLITFDLSIRKLLKNALIFSMLGVKRNLLALLGIVLVAGLNFALIVLCLNFGFTFALVLPLFYFPALAGFIAAYAAFPNIQRYMIDPVDDGGDASEETGCSENGASVSEDAADGAPDGTTPPEAD